MEDKVGEKIYITVVYHLSSSSAIKYLQTFNEVTAITTPFENVVIWGTKLGSIWLFDLDENVQDDKPNLGDEVIKDFEIEALKRHYKIMTPTFSTDGLSEPVHIFDIK